jgi:SAM-dependent methyltransferase
MSLFEWLSGVLSRPGAYRTFSWLIGGNVWRVYLDQYVKPGSYEKILDIGCGTADILEFLPRVDYLGVDLSPEYIDSAQKRFGARGRFRCADVASVNIEPEHGTFTLALATGVLHHLADDEAHKLFALARLALQPSGRLITYDGCYVPNQSNVARWFLRRDRAKFVRTPEQYQHLAVAHFSRVESHLRQDLLRVPYTHLIMRCSNGIKPSRVW